MRRTVTSLMDGWEFCDDRAPGQWREVELPHDWAIERPVKEDMPGGGEQAFRDRWGIGWYRRTFHMDERPASKACWIHSDGIYECSSIHVNGVYIGGHDYGYSPFSCDLSDAVHPGENEILIRVDNTRTPPDRWYSGAGIYRQLSIVEASNPHLDQDRVSIKQHIDVESSRADLSCRIPLVHSTREHEPRDLHIRASLVDKNGIVAASGKLENLDGTLKLSVSHAHLWSAEDPYLYKLHIGLYSDDQLIDDLKLHIGLRRVSFDAEQGMLVNGSKVIFKGVCLHQDLGCMGSRTSSDLLRQRLLLLKKMGCNGIRAAHHAHPTELLDLCDELGFYVYDEAFDKWFSGHDEHFFAEHWKEDLAALMYRDRNRPSVVIWGLGNEVEHQAQPAMLRTLSTMVDYAHGLDPTRPACCALSPHFQRPDQSNNGDGIVQATDDVSANEEISDLDGIVGCIKAVADVSDMVVVNYAEQWYERIHKAISDKPIFGSEVYQYFSGHPDQMQNFTDANPNLVPFEHSYVVGGAIWAGFDYLGESMGYPSKGWSGALIRTDNIPKTGYFLMQSYWSREPMVHFCVLDYSQPDEMVKEHWDMPPYLHHWDFPGTRRRVLPFMIATNCDTVRLFLNGKEFHLEHPNEERNRCIKGYLPYIPGCVHVEGYRNGKKVCQQTVQTPSKPARLLFGPDTKSASIGLFDSDKTDSGIMQRFPADKGFRCLIGLRCVDKDRVLCFRSNPLIHFEVQGPIRMVGLDDGCLLSNGDYGAKQMRAYQGQCGVVIGGTGEAGPAKIMAQAEGIEPAVLECLMS